MNRRGAMLALGAAVSPGRSGASDEWPVRTITLVVPFAPGGIADITARSVGEAMARRLGRAIIVDNRPSAGSIVGSAAVAHAPADGYTLLLMSNANAVSTSLFRKLPFDVVRDLAPITTLGYFDLGVFVADTSRLRSLADIVGEATAKPGRLTIGTISIGSTQHLAAELFKTKAGIDALIIPYKGTPALLTALRSGEIDVVFEILGPMLAQVAAKAVRVVAVTSRTRYPTLQDVPTVAEAGVPGYAVASWNALAAPTGTPAAVIDRLNAAVRSALEQESVRRRLQELGVRPQASSPRELETLLTSEIRRWRDVIRTANIQPQ
jgi:tripartite-type tricarboxylate transporter receptor subunit TctC